VAYQFSRYQNREIFKNTDPSYINQFSSRNVNYINQFTTAKFGWSPNFQVEEEYYIAGDIVMIPQPLEAILDFFT